MTIEHRKLEPLLIAIEGVTEAIGDLGDVVKSHRLRIAIEKLKTTHDDYAKCCCRIAHVIKLPNIFERKAAAPKARRAAPKAGAGAAKARAAGRKAGAAARRASRRRR
jgi:hypothetical protein